MDINDNILSIISLTPADLLRGIAGRVKARRLELHLTQEQLAARAGIALPTYRRFERSGEIALRGLVMLAIALDATAEFASLFATSNYSSMDELLNAKQQSRKRGKRHGSN